MRFSRKDTGEATISHPPSGETVSTKTPSLPIPLQQITEIESDQESEDKSEPEIEVHVTSLPTNANENVPVDLQPEL